MNDYQTGAANNQEIINIIFTNFLFPIILGILAFIASNTFNSWQSRRRQSLLGSVILQSFIEEVENGIKMKEKGKGDRFIFFILSHRGILLKLFFMSIIPINKSVPFCLLPKNE